MEGVRFAQIMVCPGGFGGLGATPLGSPRTSAPEGLLYWLSGADKVYMKLPVI